MVTEHDRCVIYELLHDTGASEVIRSRITCRSEVSARETRANVDGRLEVPRARTEFARRSFCARAVRAWNELPGDIRRSPTFGDI